MKKVIFSLLLLAGVMVCFTNCKKDDKDPTYQELVVAKWDSDKPNDYGQLSIKSGGKFSWVKSPWTTTGTVAPGNGSGIDVDGKWEIDGQELTLRPDDKDKIKFEITTLISKSFEFEGKLTTGATTKSKYSFSK